MDPEYSYALFSENARSVCNYICASILLILVFVVSPLRRYSLLSLLGKTIVVVLLIYTIYKNVMNIQHLTKLMQTSFLDGTWDAVKTNIVCSLILTFFIFVLLFSVLQNFF